MAALRFQSEHQYAEYLSIANVFPTRRSSADSDVVYRDLSVGRTLANVPMARGTERKDRLCQVCHSLQDV